ncbi:MAG: hypothetical protein OEY03_12580 [Rhizobacter sp.]|nr:hypothetical protein [Rhizobacter sp.]
MTPAPPGSASCSRRAGRATLAELRNEIQTLKDQPGLGLTLFEAALKKSGERTH